MSAQAVRLSNVDINNALENKDFEVLFQPIFDLSNGALARMETFVRWRHPTLGVLPPGAFISFFESQGRMGELTRYILDTALARYAAWRGPFAPGFSVNLSLADLADDDFTDHLTSAIEAIEFPSDLITLECPMPAVDSDIESMADRFAQLRETGARLAIEVRGRANEFLRTVDPFPFDEIKTGGSSILRFARTVRGPGLSAISDLLDIAKKANAVTTAVGVEDQASLAALRDLGFTAAQGNHLAKVGDLNEFRPARVNTVREQLGLPALSGDELAALFRTTAPTPGAGDAQPVIDVEAEDAPAKPVEAEETPPPAENAADREALVARARKKAKAIALAKRAKARDARKAAAIKRAKAKVAQAKDGAVQSNQERREAGNDPRVLQNKIAEEFSEAAATADETQPVPHPSEGSSAPMADDNSETRPDAKQPPQKPAAPDAPMQMKMPVGQSGAYFRPGYAVASDRPTIHAETIASPTPAQETRQETPAPGAATSAELIDVAFSDEPASAPTVEQEESALDAFAETPIPDEEPAAPIAEKEAVAAVSDGVKRRKNFLQRKYKFPPSHFWPKPWKRAWRRQFGSTAEA